MEIGAILRPDCARSAVPGASKKRILEYISSLAAEHMPGVEQQQLFESLLARERLGSTGIGRGIAIPHGRLPDAKGCVAVLVQCESGIQFDAIDRQPVDILFALFVPEADCNAHLATLAQLAEKLSDRDICKQLRHAKNDDELYQIMTTG